MIWNDPYRVRQDLKLSDSCSLAYYSLSSLEEKTKANLSRLPFSIRILLESLLRNCDGFAITEEHIAQVANWRPEGERREIPFKPARVVLQDFTGVPALVDLAAMRDAVQRLGGDPKKINPLIPCDLVIDHSVQVDYYGQTLSLALNEAVEFERNAERYAFLKWGQAAFRKLRVVPPTTGIVHQVNLEYLSQVIFRNPDNNLCYPDSCVGTDSHTPMVNGLGVLAWGVGGIEAEAVMLDQPIYMLVPDVVGIKLTGRLLPGVNATDLVLRITELCRSVGMVGKFVEFFGPGLSSMSIPDRATVGNMAPEQGSTVSYFPIDALTLDYMRLTGRSAEQIELTERYAKAQGLFRTDDMPDPLYSQVLTVDLADIEPAVAGPKRPHDRISLTQLGSGFRRMLTEPVGFKGFGLAENALGLTATVSVNHVDEEIGHGAVVIAAITSCTNTSNPSVMLAAGLLAKKAVERGLRVKNYVKTSLAPGSTVVTEYLKKSGLLPYLEQLGFYLVGYGCTTCIGNSGPLEESVAKGIVDNDLVVSAVLSGNRNFEGRVHPLTKSNFLASPPLVVAFALAGSTAVDIATEPLGFDKQGMPVYLKDIWPADEEINAAIVSFVTPEMFRERYAEVFTGTEEWRKIPAAESELYPWNEQSTYIRKPPFFDDFRVERKKIEPFAGIRILALFGDSVSTDHISPAGQIAADSPAGLYLAGKGIARKDWNSYGSRRGNDEVMCRGTFANIRIRNRLIPGSEGNRTIFHPTGEQMTIYDAAMRYKAQGIPLCILAGKEYGSGSSRDWAAKGPYLQGVKAVIAESYERIHRSNLIGMGILPLQFEQGQNAESLGLAGAETLTIELDDNLQPKQTVQVIAKRSESETLTFHAVCRIDTPIEIDYYRDGGILRTVLKKLLSKSR
jgi:aconitate hydratase